MKQLKHKQNKTANSKTVSSSVGRLVSLVLLTLMIIFSVIIFAKFTFNKADGNYKQTKETQTVQETKDNKSDIVLPSELESKCSDELFNRETINNQLITIAVDKEARDKYYNKQAIQYIKNKDIINIYDTANNSGLNDEANRLLAEKEKQETKPVPRTVKTVTQSGQATYTLTAYCYTGNATASGVMPTANHTVAADLSIFPMGTKLSINGVIYTVEDTGGAIHGNIFDIYFNTYDECINFGRQKTTNVFVVQ